MSGGFFTRLGLGGIPFLFPLLYQIGLGFSPIQSGLLVLPQAIASIGLKTFMPAILARLGYRNVLVGNTIVVGLMIMSFATVGAHTPIWLIVGQAFVLGFFTSMQYTSMNTLVYADVSAAQTSAASTIAATGQQLAISFGVAGAALVAAIFVPPELHSHPAAIIARRAAGLPGAGRADGPVVGRVHGAEGRRRRGHEPATTRRIIAGRALSTERLPT